MPQHLASRHLIGLRHAAYFQGSVLSAALLRSHDAVYLNCLDVLVGLERRDGVLVKRDAIMVAAVSLRLQNMHGSWGQPRRTKRL